MAFENNAKLRILLIEDSPFDFELIQEHLRAELDCHLVEVTSRVTLLNELDRALPDVIISDYNLPRFDGISALDFMQGMYPRIPFILCSGNNSQALHELAVSRGAKAWVSKDDLPRLVKEIKRVCRGE